MKSDIKDTLMLQKYKFKYINSFELSLHLTILEKMSDFTKNFNKTTVFNIDDKIFF